jgi:translation initiation factor 2B subunit (eIF-2B alpha/beta/delta family)
MDGLVEVFSRAVGDRRHGAAEIERRLVEDLLLRRSEWSAGELRRGAERLHLGQPAMANLRKLGVLLSGGGLEGIEAQLRRRLQDLEQLDARLAATAWPLIEPFRRVLTLSRSSAVAAVLAGAWRRGWRGETVVFDGGPEGRGEEQAERLAATMGGIRSQPDAAMPSWLSGPDLGVVIGADAVSPSRLVNVCGTAILLELAVAREIPVVLVADTGKEIGDDELDELLEHAPVAGNGRCGRSWRLFEAVPLSRVSDRVRE